MKVTLESPKRLILSRNTSFDSVAQRDVSQARKDRAANVPVPKTVSEEAQRLLRNGFPLPEAAAKSLAEQRAICTSIQEALGAHQLQSYPVLIEEGLIAGVTVRHFQPMGLPTENERILLNFHGGGFIKDSGSLTENIPICFLTQMEIIAVCYRLAPEHRFPAAVDDAEKVYSAVVKVYAPQHIGIYGTSAGAILSAQAIVRFARDRIPCPSLLGFFSGTADLSRPGDSEYLFPLPDDSRPFKTRVAPHLAGRSVEDPEVSPLFGDLREFPPTLCLCGTRDLMLSQTSIFHRALLHAGVNAKLEIFEAMPHAHWSYLNLPESDEAFRSMARFFRERLIH